MTLNMPQAKTVLVTGAAKRLGRAIALNLAQHGWQVAVHYQHSKAEALATVEALTQFTKVAAFAADLSDALACKRLFFEVTAYFGQVHALVNNASVFENDVATHFEAATAQKHFAVNTVAPIELAQALYQHLEALEIQAGFERPEKKHGEESRSRTSFNHDGDAKFTGAVVNLLDQKLWNLNPDFLSYTLSKAALAAATTMMAQSFAPRLRVCGVAPGLSFPSYLQNSEAFTKAHQVSPLGRSSSPEDVAATVRFVLENSSMTGSQILVDGGQHLMHLPRDISFL